MRIKYDKITLESIILLMDLFPDYNFICDGDSKEIVIKEKVKDEKNRWSIIYKNYVNFNNVNNGYIYLYDNR